MAVIDKAALLAGPVDIPEGTVPLPGGDVIVRGLSRAEVVRLQSCTTTDALENETLAAGMVEPSLTVEEAAAWRAVPGNNADVRAVSDAILSLSGLGEGDQTSKERRFRPGRG